VEVVSPPELRAKVADKISQMLGLYR